MVFWGLLAGLAILLAVHTARSRFRRRLLSAAQFFKTLPPPRKSSPRLSLSNPFKIPALYLRILWMLLLILAVWAANRKFQTQGAGQVRVWLLLDTSSSMTTKWANGTYWDAAKNELKDALAEIASQTPGRESFYRLSLFDQALRDLDEGQASDDPIGKLVGILPRSLGTDLGLIRRALQKEGRQSNFTSAVVISDRPAPAWLAEINSPQVFWRDVSQPVTNIAIEGLEAQRNPLTGKVTAVNVSVIAYGANQPTVSLAVREPGRSDQASLPVLWRNQRFGSVILDTPKAGTYGIRLLEGGSYSGDDSAQFAIPIAQGIRVDWQLQNRQIPESLGWVMTAQNPRFRVIDDLSARRDQPFLLIGQGLTSGESEIRDFVEASPLLADLNFDVVEQFQPVVADLPQPFQSHLRDTQNRVWAATISRPVAAYVPGLPQGVDDPGDRLLTTLFFNAVRWLLQESEPVPIYSLTSPLQPEPKGTRLNLHPGEGDTSAENRSFGDWADLTKSSQRGPGQPWWPLVLTAAMVIFFVERVLSLWGGRSWR